MVNLVTFALSRKTGLKFMCQVEKQDFCDTKIKISQDVEGVRRSLIAHCKVQIIRNPHCEKIGKYKLHQNHHFSHTFHVQKLQLIELKISC